MKSFKEWKEEQQRVDEFFFKPKFNYVGRDCTYVMNPDLALKQFGQQHVDDCVRKHAENNKKQKSQRPFDVNSPKSVAGIQSRLSDYDIL